MAMTPGLGGGGVFINVEELSGELAVKADGVSTETRASSVVRWLLADGNDAESVEAVAGENAVKMA